MTPEEREALATSMRRAFADADGCGQARMRAALAVAERVVRADEREACAKVADGTPYHGRYRTWTWWANPDGSLGNRENESDVVRHADAIATAIRARGAA